MKTTLILFFTACMTSFGSYAQGDCEIQKIVTSRRATIGLEKTQAKRLTESFGIFEDLLKTKDAGLFLKKADADFKAFGKPKDQLIPVLNQISTTKICVTGLTVDDQKTSSIFFHDIENVNHKMVLKVNEKGRYVSWNNLESTIKESHYLSGDVVKIPVAIIRDWLFIDGEINGVQGQWMFDTGNSEAFSLHSKKVLDVPSETAGSGFVASGQKFEVLRYPKIDQLKVADNVYDSVKNVRGNNYDFLEGITTTVIGQVGFAFFDGYDMKLDYLRSELTFYKQKEDVENWTDIKKHKNYITSLPYFTRRLDNIPMIKIQHKGIDFLVTLDTGGGKGSFTMEEPNFEKLKKEGDIENFLDEPGTLYSWYNIKIDERLTINLFGMDKEDSSPSHKPLQITEKNTFTLDYSFLSQYITIWDTKNKVLHILKKK